MPKVGQQGGDMLRRNLLEEGVQFAVVTEFSGSLKRESRFGAFPLNQSFETPNVCLVFQKKSVVFCVR